MKTKYSDVKKRRYTITVPESLDDVLQNYVDATGYTKSSVITMALIDFFEECGLFSNEVLFGGSDNKDEG